MSIEIGPGEAILTIRPPLFRRVVPIAAMGFLALALIYFGLSERSEGLVWKLCLLLGGGGILAVALRFHRATAVGLELTREALRDTTGREICRLDGLQKVDRSAFGFKPSNGLALVQAQPGPLAWEPGLWWRIGRRLGIGGATSLAQARALADTIKLLEVERAQEAQEAQGAEGAPEAPGDQTEAAQAAPPDGRGDDGSDGGSEGGSDAAGSGRG